MREELRQVREHLGEAAHRELLQRVPGLAALGLHLRPGDAREAHLRDLARARRGSAWRQARRPRLRPRRCRRAARLAAASRTSSRVSGRCRGRARRGTRPAARNAGAASRRGVDLRAGIVERQPFAVQRLVRAPHREDVRGGEAAAPQALVVRALRLRRVALHDRERRHVLQRSRRRASIACAPTRQNWCTPRERAHHHAVPDVTWPAICALFGTGRVVADDAVVGDVRVGEKEVAVADRRVAAVLRRAAR